MKLAIVDECLAEAEVGDHDDDPGKEAGDGGDIYEPVEDRGTSVGDVEVCEQGKHPGEQNCNIRHTSSVGDTEELRCLAVERHRVQHSGTGVQERVSSRPGRCQDCRVNRMVEAMDAGVLYTKHEWTGAGIGRSEQVRVIVRHDDSYDERSKSIEQSQTPNETLCSFWDVPTRINRFSRCNGNELWRGNEREPGLDKRMPVTQESPCPCMAMDQVVVEGPWMFPISESKSVVIGSTAKEEHNAENDEPHDRDKLDTGKPELGLSEEGHSDDVQQQYNNQHHSDPHSNVDRGFPVVKHNGCRAGLSSHQHGIGIPVIPTTRE